MLPSPTTPKVFPRSSLPRNLRFSHLPALVDWLANGMERANESINASVCSATETALPPGVFMTRTPAAVAAGRSTLSTPTPARPMTRSFGALESRAALTSTALRTINASAVARCCAYSFGFETMTSQPCCFRSFTAAGASGSAIRICMLGFSNGGCFFGQRDLCGRVLARRQAGSKFHRETVSHQDDFQFGDDPAQVGE